MGNSRCWGSIGLCLQRPTRKRGRANFCRVISQHSDVWSPPPKRNKLTSLSLSLKLYVEEGSQFGPQSKCGAPCGSLPHTVSGCLSVRVGRILACTCCPHRAIFPARPPPLLRTNLLARCRLALVAVAQWNCVGGVQFGSKKLNKQVLTRRLVGGQARSAAQ